MLFRTLCLLSLALMPYSLGQLDDWEHDDGNFVITEEFNVHEENGGDARHFLRRQLQTSNVCTATGIPRSVYACGRPGDHDKCQDSDATCAGEFPDGYSCSCTGSSDTTCTYCQVRTAGTIMCQVTGARSTFATPEGTMQTCQCDYLGGGQVQQTCWTPTPPPIPVPTFFPAPVPRHSFAPVPIPSMPPIPTPAPVIAPASQVRNPDAPGGSGVSLPAEQPSSSPPPAMPVAAPKTSLRNQFKLYRRAPRNADMP